jgi:predicted DCC family thiol-disulfide oxidoreductase YuxK
MIFDGECSFCRAWIRRWQYTTGPTVTFLPSQDPTVRAQFPELPAEKFSQAVQLIENDGSVYSGAEAVFRLLAARPATSWPLWLYRHLPGGDAVAEWSYRLVASHRQGFSVLTRLLWGQMLTPPSYDLVRAVFLRLLGIVYLIAFLSLGTQLLGLIGSQGILPVSQLMASAREQFEQQGIGWDRYRLLPTLCWLSAGDGFLQTQCAAGALLAVLLIVGIAPAPCLFLLWLIYLSLATVGQDFLSFQWDNLLLETGWLAIFLAPLDWLLRKRAGAPPLRTVLWLLRWLLFRLMFQSGCVKLLSGDSLWRSLTALEVHYETQPLPTWIGWYAHQLPARAQRLSAAVMFVLELAVPFLVFAPRRLRLWSCLALTAFQLLIFLTGNYCFFNLLTLALCFLLLDDRAVVRWLPRRWRNGLLPAECSGKPPEPDPGVTASAQGLPIRAPSGSRGWPWWLIAPTAMVVILVSCMELVGMFRFQLPWPASCIGLYRWVAPLRSVNSYGLFAVMTNPRLELVVEGSNDGEHWSAYGFKHKPGDPKRRPDFVAPHQPRLDWQMWFAALGTYRENPWFINFCIRLLQGSPEVLALLERNPFPTGPPRFIRTMVYRYHFTDWATRKSQGTWWTRTLETQYCPAFSLQDLEPRTH